MRVTKDAQMSEDQLKAIKECHPCQQGKTLIILGVVFALYAIARFMFLGHVSLAAIIVSPTMIILGLIARRQYKKAVCKIDGRVQN